MVLATVPDRNTRLHLPGNDPAAIPDMLQRAARSRITGQGQITGAAADGAAARQGARDTGLALILFEPCGRVRLGAMPLAFVLALSAILALVGAAPARTQGPQAPAAGGTGLPLPRFVSLKSDRVQVRQGPGTDHKILWVFNRIGLPVEVIEEHENWRQVRDQDGSVGWVANALLSARRTGVIMAWATGEARTGAAKPVPLLDEDTASARQIALLEPGVICGIRRCDGRWCNISVGDYRGYIEQSKLWGVYPGESVR